MTGTRYVSTTDTAKMIRATLRGAFPGVKFSVRSDKYAGGSSIRIAYVGGPAQRDVQATVDWYAGSDFDGMTDSTTYRPDRLVAAPDGTLETLSFAPDFVFVDRTSPDADEAEALAEVIAAVESIEGQQWRGIDAYDYVTPDEGWSNSGYALVYQYAARIGAARYAVERALATR